VLCRRAGLAALLLADHRAARGAFRRTTVDDAQQRQRVDAEQPGDDQADHDGAQADPAATTGAAGNPHAAQAAEATTTTAASILDVPTLSLSAPPHGLLPADSRSFQLGFCPDQDGDAALAGPGAAGAPFRPPGTACH